MTTNTTAALTADATIRAIACALAAAPKAEPQPAAMTVLRSYAEGRVDHA